MMIRSAHALNGGSAHVRSRRAACGTAYYFNLKALIRSSYCAVSWAYTP
jgi:hypothetical protein